MKIIGVLLMCVFLAACSDPKTAERVLTDHGYTDIQIHGHSFWGCSDNDNFTTKFTAKAPTTGRAVNGVVCSNWWGKGATIRFY